MSNKRILLVVVILALMTVAGCSQPSSSAPVEPVQNEQPNEPSQEELNAQLKQRATKADFIELNGKNAPVGKSVYATGSVMSVIKPGSLGEFMLSVEEGDGYGIYIIRNLDLGNSVDEENIQVTLWGSYYGKHEKLGGPVILATIIEKQ